MGKITYKIDRITSNAGVEFGLKSGATITGSTDGLTIAKPMFYSGTIASTASDSTLVNKKYITSAISAEESTIYSLLRGNYLTAGTNITLTKGDASSDPTVQISLTPVPSGERPTNLVYGYASSGTGAYSEKQNANITSTADASKKVLAGIKTDEYGRVIGVYTKTVSTSDLQINGAVDNYVQWNLQIGSGDASATNTLLIGSGNTAATTDNPVKAFGTGAGQSNIVNLKFLSGNGMTITRSSGSEVTFGTNILANGGLGYDGSGKLYIPDQTGLTATATPALYNIAFNAKGLITAVSTADMSSITGQLTAHSASASGVVLKKDTANTASSAATTSTYFYASDAKWYQINWDNVKAEALSSGTTDYQILAAANTNSTTTAKRQANITINGNGVLKATKFEGSGANLTNLNASNLSDGTVAAARLPKDDIIDWIIPTDISTAGQVLLSGSSENTITALAKPTSTTNNEHYVLETAIAGGQAQNPQWTNITQLVQTVVSGEGGMIFKGLMKLPTASYYDGASHDGYIYGLPTAANEGHFYRIAEAGNYNINGTSTHLELGDAVYCIATFTASTSITEKWAVLQKNIDRAIVAGTGSTPTSGNLAVKSSSVDAIYDAIGFTYANSTYTLTAAITGNAGTATKLATKRKIWGVDFDGTADISGAMTGVNSIAPTSGSAGNIGAANNKYGTVYATTFSGALSGNATSADKVNKSLSFTGSATNTNNVTFDGSTDKTVDLSAATLGFATSVSIAAASDSGNCITGFSTPSKDSTTGVVTITPTKGYMISSVTSTPFAIGGSNGTATIGWKTSATDGTFYTASSFGSTTSSSVLYLGGSLYAKDLSVYRTKEKKVATMIDNVGTENTILVNADNQDSTGKAGFKASTVHIVTSVGNPSADDTMATAKAVKTYVDTSITNSEANCMKVAKASFSGTSTTASATIPANAIVDHIDLYVSSKYTAATTLAIKIGTTTIVDTTENAVDDENDQVYSYKFGKALSTTAATCNLALSGTNTAGAGTVYVYYTI